MNVLKGFDVDGFEYNGITFECMGDLIDYALELGKQDKKKDMRELFDVYTQYVYIKDGYTRLNNAFEAAKYRANCQWAELLDCHYGDEDWRALHKILNLVHPVYGPAPSVGQKPYEHLNGTCDGKKFK